MLLCASQPASQPARMKEECSVDDLVLKQQFFSLALEGPNMHGARDECILSHKTIFREKSTYLASSSHSCPSSAAWLWDLPVIVPTKYIRTYVYRGRTALRSRVRVSGE